MSVALQMTAEGQCIGCESEPFARQIALPVFFTDIVEQDVCGQFIILSCGIGILYQLR